MFWASRRAVSALSKPRFGRFGGRNMSTAPKQQLGRREATGMFVLVGAVASELMWIIRIKNQREDVERTTSTELKIMDRILAKAKRGESVDVERELLNSDKEAEPVGAILEQLERMDEQWKTANTALPRAKSPSPEPASQLSLSGKSADGKPDTTSSSRFL